MSIVNIWRGAMKLKHLEGKMICSVPMLDRSVACVTPRDLLLTGCDDPALCPISSPYSLAHYSPLRCTP